MERSRSGRWRLAGSAGAVLAVLGATGTLASCDATATRQSRASSTVPAVRRLPVSVRLGGEVDGLAAGGGYLWAYVRDAGVLVRVDQHTGAARRFRFAAWRGMPVAATAGPGGLWLANQHATRPEVVRIDPRTGRVAARPRLPGAPGPVAGLAAAYGAVWILVPDEASPGWRVLRLNPATGRVDGFSGSIPGTQLAGHTAAIWASAGQIWVTGSMHVIARLDPRTLILHMATTADLSQGLVFGGGRAWTLSEGRPSLAVVDPRTGKVIRTMAVPPPSGTGDDYVAAGDRLLWVFRGSRLCQLNPATGRTLASARVAPIAPVFYAPAVIVGGDLWYLAQASHGTALDRIAPVW